MMTAHLSQTDARLGLLCQWIEQTLGSVTRVTAISGDASFRRYFRFVLSSGQRVIGVDAPPEHEDVQAFVKVQQLLKNLDVRVPDLYAGDVMQGFLALEDLGDATLFSVLSEDNVHHWYELALRMAALMASARPDQALPPYDITLLDREMQLFIDWLPERHLELRLSYREKNWLYGHFERLKQVIAVQTVGLVHRDFHARNLMVVDHKTLATIDFQDAVIGPVTYDLVSLIKDCYVQWPQTLRDRWCGAFREQLKAKGVTVPGQEEFLYWTDTMGIQRHLKAAGIFARLWHRDGKPGYLKDIPRTLSYIEQAGARHDAWRALGEWIQDVVQPRLAEVQEQS